MTNNMFPRTALINNLDWSKVNPYLNCVAIDDDGEVNFYPARSREEMMWDGALGVWEMAPWVLERMRAEHGYGGLSGNYASPYDLDAVFPTSVVYVYGGYTPGNFHPRYEIAFRPM